MIVLKENININNYTLIVPSVAVGNVGQLSVDLLISTLGLKRIGRIFDTSFIPLVGADPYDETSDDICTSIDIYASDEKKLVIVQIRSPIVKKPSNFFNKILNFVTDYKIAKVIILTSSFGHEKRDEQIRTAPFRYLATENVIKDSNGKFNDLSWIALEPKLVDDFTDQTILTIHGGGFAKALFEFLQENNIYCIILLKFCLEGDNIPDAIELINYMNQWLQLIPVNNNICKLKFPPSWKFLFGNSSPKEIY